jgi:nucleoid-associated protein YgaU
MANRYYYGHIFPNARKVESDGNVKTVRRLSSTMYPNFNTENDTLIVSQEGDRLDLLAKEYYGDPSFWFVIARANNLGKGSMNIPGGKIIRVPYYTEYGSIQTMITEFNKER